METVLRCLGALTGKWASGQNVVGLTSVSPPLDSVTVGQRVSLNPSFPAWDMQTYLQPSSDEPRL